MIYLSLRALFAHKSGRAYAITTTFDGRDLVNGGTHRAVDVGNFGMDDPILSPITGRARGLYHFDTAIGIEYDLGNGWTLQLWHLNATLSAGLSLIPGRSDDGDWVNVTRAQVCGRTGNSGALVNGQPMPAHTHIELERAGARYDVAPYLLGQPFDPFQEDDMKLPADASYFATGKVGAGNRLRIDHATTDGSEVVTAELDVQLLGIVTGGTPYTLPDGRKGNRWYVIRRADTGDVRQVAHLLVTAIAPTPALFSQVPIPAADCSAQDNQLRAGRTAIAGAVQAHEAAGRALAVAQEAVA
jgi:hypothetical protein